MKNMKNLIPFLMLITLVITSCKKEETIVVEDETPIEVQLTATELEMMHYMMEEEKLAYDVYVTLFDIYGTIIFNSISKSELTHIAAVNQLLAKYNITNTASSTIGVYNIEHIQELYDALVAKGSLSLIDALTVGAIIEDVDIYDLEKYLGETENADIISVFNFLNCGSRNHLRGFMGQLELQGVNYTPQYITQERFDEIVNDSHETCASYTLD
ncbi:MAG: DUF2202 domain-containing protein [Bacteroidales bacterium]|nr:DUF2202 domain-containing protein [Bacteroidales bacterium]